MLNYLINYKYGCKRSIEMIRNDDLQERLMLLHGIGYAFALSLTSLQICKYLTDLTKKIFALCRTATEAVY